MFFMYAFLLSKHAFLERVHSQYFAVEKPRHLAKKETPQIIAPKHIKGTFSQTLLKRLNLGKRTSETGSERRN